MFLLQTHFFCFSQSTFEVGLLPSVNVNAKLKNDWSLNFKLESRQLVQSGEIDGDVDRSFRYVLTDFGSLLVKKIGLNSRICGGYLIRLEEGVFLHRFSQQFITVQKWNNFRFAHRILLDQTFSSNEAAEFRLRYRISSELPLNGESADPGEFYFKLNNEYVNSIQGKVYDLEIRLIPMLGFGIKDNLKIETGLDYRVDSFITGNSSHSFWWATNFFIDL